MNVVYKITYLNGEICIEKSFDRKEIQYIRKCEVNNPKIGYNSFLKFKAKS